MKTRIILSLNDSGNPNYESFQKAFNEIKEDLEFYLTSLADKGIVPNIDDMIDGEHPDGSISNYQVIERKFQIHEILLTLSWV